MAQVLPLRDKVLVRRLQPKTESEGGIYIPTEAREKPLYGVVLALGSKVDDELKENTMVLFGKYSGVEVNVGNEILLLLRDEEIFGIVTDVDLIKKYMSEGVSFA